MNGNFTRKTVLERRLRLTEQNTIASFLDRETSITNGLVAKYERLIELIEEKRIAVIKEAITKGLNASAPMMRTDVPWIGQMPKHWNLRRLSSLFKNIGSGTTPDTDNASYYGGNIPFVTTSELRENVITETSKKISHAALQAYSALKVHPRGSLLIAMYGATIGRLGLLGMSSAVNQACCVITPGQDMLLKFAYYWLLGMRNEVITFASGGGQPNISQGVIKALRLSTPPIREQEQIIAHLDKYLERLDRLGKSATIAIGLLRERNASMISAVVTGQINVSDNELRLHAEAVA